MAKPQSLNLLSFLKRRQDDMAALSQLLDLIDKSKGLLSAIAGAISCLPILFGGFIGNTFSPLAGFGLPPISDLPIGLRFVIFFLLITFFAFTFSVVIDWLERLRRDYREFAVVLISLFAGYLTVSLSDWLYPALTRDGPRLFPVFVAIGLVLLIWLARLRFQRYRPSSPAMLTCRVSALFWTPLAAIFFTTLMIVEVFQLP